MQLRFLFSLFRRFWVLVVILPFLVGAISLTVELRQLPRYGSVIRIMVTQTPHYQQVQPFPDLNLIHSWQSSEFIVDDMPQVISSMMLAQDVSAWLKGQSYDVDPAVVRSGLSATTIHRSVIISSQASDPDLAVKMLEGVIASLQANGLKYWNRSPDEGNGLQIAVLDPANSANPLQTPRQLALNVGTRMILALVAGVAISLLISYLDDRLHNAYQVETWIGVPVLGVIPKETHANS